MHTNIIKSYKVHMLLLLLRRYGQRVSEQVHSGDVTVQY